MKVIKELLLQYLAEKKMTVSDFACEIGVTATEIEKMLNGEAVGRKTAQLFIYYFGADKAQRFIDWAAIGKQNPLAHETASTEENQ